MNVAASWYGAESCVFSCNVLVRDFVYTCTPFSALMIKSMFSLMLLIVHCSILCLLHYI